MYYKKPYYSRGFKRAGAYKRRYNYKNKYTSGYGTKPYFMSKQLKKQRWNQTSVRCMYFKTAYEVKLEALGTGFYPFTTQDLKLNAQFAQMLPLYDQYKCVAIMVKWYPSNVGIESHDSFLNTDLTLLRGNHCVWSDQRIEGSGGQQEQGPTAINQIINTASAKLINARQPYSRTLYRPTGKSPWGSTQEIGTTPDPWRGAIYHYYQDATSYEQADLPVVNLFFVTVTWKCLFRGRQQNDIP